MNKIARLFLVAIAATLGNGLCRGPEADRVTPGRLQPGDVWLVELLPETERLDSQGERLHAKPSAEEDADGVVIEKNVVGQGFRRQTFFSESGQKSSERLIKGVAVLQSANDGASYELDILSDEFAGGRVSSERLREFDWLKNAVKIGSAILDGVECDLYAPAGKEGSREEVRLEDAQWAAISRTDGRPKRQQNELGVYRYTWSAQAPPELPAAAAETLERFYRAAQRQRDRHNVAR